MAKLNQCFFEETLATQTLGCLVQWSQLPGSGLAPCLCCPQTSITYWAEGNGCFVGWTDRVDVGHSTWKPFSKSRRMEVEKWVSPCPGGSSSLCKSTVKCVSVLILAQLQVMVHGWVSSVLHFSVSHIRSPGTSRRRWAFSCSALGHITWVMITRYCPLQVCGIMRKTYSLVEEVFPPPVEWHRSVIAVAHGCLQLSWWTIGTADKHKPPSDTRAEKTGHGLMSSWEEKSEVLIQFKPKTSCFNSKPSEIKWPGHVWNDIFRTVHLLQIFCSLNFYPDCVQRQGYDSQKFPWNGNAGPSAAMCNGGAVQDLLLKGRSLEGEEERALFCYQAALQID